MPNKLSRTCLFPHYWLSLSGTAKTKNCDIYPEVYSGNTNTNVKHYRWNLERLFAGLAIKRVRAGSGVAVGNFPLRKCYSRHCFTKLALTASASSFMKRATLDIKTPLRLHFENRLYARRSMQRPKRKNLNMLKLTTFRPFDLKTLKMLECIFEIYFKNI